MTLETMEKDKVKKCHAIIHTASGTAAAVGAGLAQVPGSDNVILVPIQVTMIIALGAVFDIKLSESAANATLATATATIVGRGVSQYLVGWMPLVGNIINATTAAAITELIGWAVVKEFKPEL